MRVIRVSTVLENPLDSGTHAPITGLIWRNPKNALHKFDQSRVRISARRKRTSVLIWDDEFASSWPGLGSRRTPKRRATQTCIQWPAFVWITRVQYRFRKFTLFPAGTYGQKLWLPYHYRSFMSPTWLGK